MNLFKGICIVLLSTFSLLVSAQTGTVRGTVVDTDGEPLIGVTVQVQGTTTGTVTDIDGNFTLSDVPANATLEISYVGMHSQTVALEGRSTIQVTMVEDTEQLDEIVVVGYGTMRREAVTGSVSSIQADDIRQIATGNLTSALQGRLPGVQMQQSSS
ncbi:MAG: carboxypeptidase-like regulatory domain-containing protein, partial [Fermentimonas sp.]